MRMNETEQADARIIDIGTNGWNGCGDVLIQTTEGLLDVKPDEAVQIAERIIFAAIKAMDWRQVRELSNTAASWMNVIHDYARAMYLCPNCGVGPYPDEHEPFEQFDGKPEEPSK